MLDREAWCRIKHRVSISCGIMRLFNSYTMYLSIIFQTPFKVKLKFPWVDAPWTIWLKQWTKSYIVYRMVSKFLRVWCLYGWCCLHGRGWFQFTFYMLSWKSSTRTKMLMNSSNSKGLTIIFGSCSWPQGSHCTQCYTWCLQYIKVVRIHLNQGYF